MIRIVEHNVAFAMVLNLVLLIAAGSAGGLEDSTEHFSAFPLDVCEGDSLLARWEDKQVYESRVIDDMEGGAKWVSSGIGQMSYTQERSKDGRQSLRFRNSLRDEEHYRKHRSDGGSFTGNQGGDTWMQLRFDKPQDWSDYNRISLWVYVHPTTMPTYCFNMRIGCEGAPSNASTPRPSHFVQDLKPGRWNHVLWEIPHLKRDKVTTFTIGQLLRGHDPEDEGIVTYDFDELEVQRVGADMYEGWEVAPGRFAFCHVGYRPGDKKIAFAGEGAGSTFELVDTSDKVVFAADVRVMNNRRGQFRVIDFSPYRQPGKYRLRSGSLLSRQFRIGEDVWEQPIFKAVNFFFCERCGYAVPGIHRVCHQDWQGFRGDVKKVINGGWHDAGDLSQGAWRTAMSTYAILRLIDVMRQDHRGSELEKRLTDEAVWGLKWLLKTRFGDGYHMSWSTMRIYTDNKIGTVDDVLSPARNVPWENFLAAAVECEASRLLAKSDAKLAGQSLAAAVEDWDAAVTSRKDANEAEDSDGTWWGEAEYLEAAWGATSSVLLARKTGDSRYAEHAVRFGRLLLKCQEQRFVDGIPITGYFYRDTSRSTVIHLHHTAFQEAPLIALAMLCEEFPGHKDWIEWYAAAAIHSEFFLKRGSRISAPYELLPNSVWRKAEILAEKDAQRREDMLRQFEAGTRLGDEYTLRTFPIYRDNLFHGSTNIQMSSTWALAEAARLRRDAEGMHLVGRQIEWVFGANPFGQSLMYGEGYDFAPQFAYCLKNIAGSLPVGMDSMNGDKPYWSGSNEATFKEIWVEPVNRFLGTMSVYIQNVKAPSAKHAVQITAAVAKADRDSRTLRLDVTVRGKGKHTVGVKTFNAKSAILEKSVELSGDKPAEIEWQFQIDDPDKPWVIVIIVDGNYGTRQDLVGAYVDVNGLN